MLLRVGLILLAVGAFTASLAYPIVTGYQATLHQRYVP